MGAFSVILFANSVCTFLYVAVSAGLARREEREACLSACVFHALVMLLLPLVGPVLFALSFLPLRAGLFRAVRPQALLSREEEKRDFCLQADEEWERNIVAMEEAVSVSGRSGLREVITGVMLHDEDAASAVMRLALDAADGESAHYAAAFLQKKARAFHAAVRTLEHDLQTELERDCPREDSVLSRTDRLLKEIDRTLRQDILSALERRSVTENLLALSETIHLRKKDVITCEQYVSVCQHALAVGNDDACEIWCSRLAERYPGTLPAYTCRLQLYFYRRQREAFFSVLDALEKSGLPVDRQTREILRVFQTCVPER